MLGKHLSNGWLTFETKGEKRRLAPIPADWENRSADELMELCDEATRVAPSQRLIE